MKIPPAEEEFYHAGRHVDRHYDADSRFVQLCEPPLKRIKSTLFLNYHVSVKTVGGMLVYLDTF